MGIFSRLSDILHSNVNALLDRAEDPEKMVRLIIQEMEDTLVEVRSQAARTIAEHKGIERERERLAAAIDEWARKAEFALSRNRDDLARGALVEKARLGAALAALDEERSALAGALAQSDEDVAKLEAKLAEAKAKQQTIRQRQESASVRLRVRRRLYDPHIEDAFARFEQVEKRIDRAEG
ncbi:MAG: phage shock protein PspA, partial [Alphaproteobacteria bacterium]|nr:phage shock protein PspA [Alphaproteobacteria bacterium]